MIIISITITKFSGLFFLIFKICFFKKWNIFVIFWSLWLILWIYDITQNKCNVGLQWMCPSQSEHPWCFCVVWFLKPLHETNPWPLCVYLIYSLALNTISFSVQAYWPKQDSYAHVLWRKRTFCLKFHPFLSILEIVTDELF